MTALLTVPTGFPVEDTVIQGIAHGIASSIACGQSVAGTARDQMQEPDGPDGDDRFAFAANKFCFLWQVLADGITSSNTVKTEAASAGVSWASVRRAGDSLGVIRSKGTGSFSYWNLPKMSNQGAQLLKVEQVETEIQSETEDSEVFKLSAGYVIDTLHDAGLSITLMPWQGLKVAPASLMTPELRDLIHKAKDVLNDLRARMKAADPDRCARLHSTAMNGTELDAFTAQLALFIDQAPRPNRESGSACRCR